MLKPSPYFAFTIHIDGLQERHDESVAKQGVFEEAVEGKVTEAEEPSPAEYARRRAGYIRSGGGTPPPGATPIDGVP